MPERSRSSSCRDECSCGSRGGRERWSMPGRSTSRSKCSSAWPRCSVGRIPRRSRSPRHAGRSMRMRRCSVRRCRRSRGSTIASRSTTGSGCRCGSMCRARSNGKPTRPCSSSSTAEGSCSEASRRTIACAPRSPIAFRASSSRSTTGSRRRRSFPPVSTTPSRRFAGCMRTRRSSASIERAWPSVETAQGGKPRGRRLPRSRESRWDDAALSAPRLPGDRSLVLGPLAPAFRARLSARSVDDSVLHRQVHSNAGRHRRSARVSAPRGELRRVATGDGGDGRVRPAA